MKRDDETSAVAGRIDAPLPHRPSMAFFSYARLDVALVRPMAAATRLRGVRTWLDLEDLRPGDPWRSAVAGAVRRADLFVCCVSEASLASIWTGEEIGHALEHDKPILPVILKPTSMRDLPEALLCRQALDVSGMGAAQAAAAGAEVVARMLAPAPEAGSLHRALEVWQAGPGDQGRSPAMPIASLADVAAAMQRFEGHAIGLTVGRDADVNLAAATIAALAHGARAHLLVRLHPRHEALQPLMRQLEIRSELIYA